jgi:S-formylglutathione hydrolase FrmB
MPSSARFERRKRTLNTALLLIVAVMLVAIVRSRANVSTEGAVVQHVTIDAPLIHGTAPLTLVTPAGGGSGRPLLVFLHGRGGDQNSELTAAMFRALRSAGGQAPDIVFPFGGDHSYWHDRASGAWGSYVLREVIPFALAHLHADPRRIAIGGISMGGFGAYDLARLAPGRFCAVGGHSAALGPAAGETAPGAFDDAADFRRHDVIAVARSHRHLYGRARLWLDGGGADPFHAADGQLAGALRIPLHVWPGAHDSAYWDAHWRDYMRFYATALAGCRGRD